MKVKLTGSRVRRIREALGMSVPQFSAVLAVHPGTVHRWEAAADTDVPIDGVAANILAALDQKVRNGSPAAKDFDPTDIGQQVVQALLVGGALVALGLLIGALVGRSKR